MRITIEDLDTIQREFDIRNGGWTREALSYLGLRSPLKNGWKISILHDGVPDDCPFAIGVKPQDHKWLCGKDINQNEMFEEKKAHESARVKNEHLYVMSQLDALEATISDLRQQTEAVRDQVRKLRKSISEDDF